MTSTRGGMKVDSYRPTQLQQPKKFLKIFQKPLDKPHGMWYNNKCQEGSEKIREVRTNQNNGLLLKKFQES